MPYLAAFLLVSYAFANVVGAWVVLRRKPWLAWLFAVAALILLFSAAALLSPLPFSRYGLVAGLLLASLASYLNAQLVIGKVYVRNHIIRALLGIGLYLLAHGALN